MWLQGGDDGVGFVLVSIIVLALNFVDQRHLDRYMYVFSGAECKRTLVKPMAQGFTSFT